MKEEEAFSKEDAARLFKLLSRLPSSHRSTVLSTSSSSTSSPEHHIVRAENHLTFFQTHRPFIDFLPPELLTLIGRFLVAASNTSNSERTPFRLAAVSRRWRSIFLSDRFIWGTVRFGQHQGVKKLRAFQEKAPIRDLLLRPSDEHRSDVLRAMRAGGSSLETLWVPVKSQKEIKQVWGFFERSISPCPLSSLTIIFEASFLPPIVHPLPPNLLHNVRHLDLEGNDSLIEQDPTLFDLLTLLPNLQKLDTHGFLVDSPPPPNASSPSRTLPLQLSLPNLRTCSSRGDAVEEGHPPASPILSLPSLEHLSLFAVNSFYVHFLFPIGLPPNVSLLTSLELSFVDLPPEIIFIEHLTHLLQLVTLELSYVQPETAISDATIESLVLPEGNQQGTCPFLTELALCNLPHITGPSLQRMVASRVDSETTRRLEESRHRSVLRELRHEGCGSVDVSFDPWFEEKLEHYVSME